MIDWHPYYILDESDPPQPVPCDDIIQRLEWGLRAEEENLNRVDYTELGAYLVSTIFMGVNTNPRPGAPLIFETALFKGDDLLAGVRSSTWIEAQVAHQVYVEGLKKYLEAGG